MDRDKCWGYCVLESKTVLQPIHEVLISFSFPGIDSLLLTIFIIPLILSWPSPSHKKFAVNKKNELCDIKANTFHVPCWPETSRERQRREGWMGRR